MHGNSIPVQTLISVDGEIHQRCLDAAKQELEQKEGKQFDKTFIGMQIGAHMQLANALEVLEKHVSQDLQPTLSEGAKTTRQHLAKAKSIMASLEGNAAEASQQRDTKTSRKQDRANQNK